MSRFTGIALAISVVALAGCQSEQADEGKDTAEAQAEQLDEMADEAPTEAQEEFLEQQADVVEERGEENANAMDDDGEIAPSGSGVGDTQR